jgi:ApeA N-terminal domain 1
MGNSRDHTWGILVILDTGLLEDRFLGLVAFAEGYHRALHDEPPLTLTAEKQGKKLVSEALKEHPEVRRVFTEALGHANSQPLRKRLEFFATQATTTLGWELARDSFCSQVIHTRNWMVHWGDRGQHVVEETGPPPLPRTLQRLSRKPSS